MQCKPGDLAIVVNDLDHPINNGCLLEILCRAIPGAHSIPADWVARPLSTFRFGDRICPPGTPRVVVYRDIELRPLRDSDGDDETIAWAGLPKKADNTVPATARGEVVTATLETSFLRATVQRAEQFVGGAWSLSVICGEVGFDVRVEAKAMPSGGFQPGDRIQLEYRKGDHPFRGPFIAARLIDA